ncbi:hypothetical protein INR49_001735 [Caranx melampygus]|nr:hypothetical protein INR49_018480 [Caranx melampygus]KAG7235954.1 hypothetical protein INR49_001735 [Caranx melampygus]
MRELSSCRRYSGMCVSGFGSRSLLCSSACSGPTGPSDSAEDLMILQSNTRINAEPSVRCAADL